MHFGLVQSFFRERITTGNDGIVSDRHRWTWEDVARCSRCYYPVPYCVIVMNDARAIHQIPLDVYNKVKKKKDAHQLLIVSALRPGSGWVIKWVSVLLDSREKLYVEEEFGIDRRFGCYYHVLLFFCGSSITITAAAEWLSQLVRLWWVASYRRIYRCSSFFPPDFLL